MFESLLVANRGEIALRVMKACREMGIKCMAIYSEADAQSLHVSYADEAYRIGPPNPSESYLDMHKIVELAEKVGAEAIHPGYGFLAENWEFAELCEKRKVVFVGPRSSVLKLTGDKLACREFMRKAGIQVLPSSSEGRDDVEDALKDAEEIGYPVMLKAVHGGGGRGIRVVSSKDELWEEFDAAQKEATASFGSGEMYVEEFLRDSRHIEFQILADGYGNAVHLGERECSIQRRYQKLLELSPSPMIDSVTRNRIGSRAVTAAQALGYTNAGTAEFVVNGDRNFRFIEFNSRLQVEHPVTEMVTGVDLVKEQLRIATGDGLRHEQEDIRQRGWAIECRIVAEDPANNFMPVAGKITNYVAPSGPGIRVDGTVYSGYSVPVYYDSLIAKVISWGGSFEEARVRMREALRECRMEGIPTTIPLHQVLIEDEHFISGELYTDFLDRWALVERMKEIVFAERADRERVAAIFATVYAISSTEGGRGAKGGDPSSDNRGRQNNNNNDPVRGGNGRWRVLNHQDYLGGSWRFVD